MNEALGRSGITAPPTSGGGSETVQGQTFLDKWLDQRREAIRESRDVGELDVDSLLPPNTALAAIEDMLTKYVKGQTEQIRSIAVLLSMHLQWCRHPDPRHTPPNALVLGPTGTGKTFTFRTAAEWLRLPFISIDATSLVPAGIVGQQVEDIAANLVNLADEILRESGLPRYRDDDLRLAERGVVVLDEFDKLSAPSDGRASDASLKSGVQRRVLKLLEGSPVSVGVRLHSEGAQSGLRTMDTRGLLIVAAGAFEGIDKVRARRPQSISRRPGDRDKILSVDIQNFGFIPELVARLPVMIEFSPLSQDEMLAILRDENTSPITTWTNYVRSMGATLSISEETLQVFAQRAAELSLGARGLQQVVFPVLSRVVAEALLSEEAPRDEISVPADRV